MSELTDLVAKQNKESYQLGKKHGAIEELEKIKEEVEILSNNNPSSNPILWASYDLIDREEVLDFINKRIFDLKGE